MRIGFKNQKKEDQRELGFGTKAYSPNTRLINRDGSFNVNKEGRKFWESLDIYHELISMKWVTFIGLATLLFFGINLIFALLYFEADIEGISGASGTTAWQQFLDAFYFSIQTITTVGFGHLSPGSNYVSMLSALESFLGLLGFALITGLMFARFSKPRKRLVYSKNAIIAPFNNINGLMFRFANSGKNNLIEAEMDVVMSYWNIEENRRIFERLELERRKINFLTTSWTLVHPIDEDSPMYNLTKKDLESMHVEILVMFKAFDETYDRHVYDRMSYLDEEILWGKTFVSIFREKRDGQVHVDLNKIGKVENATLN